MKIMTTRNDLRNWVDNATSDWLVRDDSDVDTITNEIQSYPHPAWGDDWSDHLETIDLVSMLDATKLTP